MNPGLAIFKKRQRYQGGTDSVVRSKQGEDDPDHTLQTTPEEMAALYQEILKQNEQSRRRAMNEDRPQRLQGGSENISDADMIARLGYDPGDPRNDLTTGFGSGRPTQRGIGTVANIGGNFIFPGFGTAVTGPAASWLTRLFQGWQGQRNVNNALNQGGGDTSGGSGTGSGEDTTDASGDPYGLSQFGGKKQDAGVGIDPEGNPAQPGQWWSPDFGRWDLGESGLGAGNYANPTGPGLSYGHLGTGFGSGTVGNFATAIGFNTLGQGGGPVDLSRYSSAAGHTRPFSAEEYANLPYLQSNKGYGYAVGQAAPGPSYEQYLAGFHAPGTVGSSTGPGGAAYMAPMSGTGTSLTGAGASGQGGHRQLQQKGTSNVGLNLFKRHQKFARGSSGIHIDPANKGKFTALQRETGKSTAELKNSPNPLTRRRANFAMMARRHFKPLGN